MIRTMNGRLALCAAALLTASISTARSSALDVVELWGILPARNQIVRINPVTGDIFGGFTPPGGALTPSQMFGGLSIAEHGAVLLYQNPVANPTSLFRLNPDTGALLSTEFMPPATGNQEFRAGLTFASGAGASGTDAIFAVNDGAPVQRQDGYGDTSLTEHTPPGATFAGALGGDDNGRHFLATMGAGAQIQEFSPTTPNLILRTIPAPPAAAALGGLAFDGQYIYLSAFDGRLWTINPDTGAVLNNVLVDEGGLIGLAARAVPEPSVAALAAIGGAMALMRRRRR